jgi:hypothetical protein
MSEDTIKIQNSAPDELPGGQEPLAVDRKSTHGGNFNQVFRSFPPAPEVQGRAATLCNPAANNRPLETVSGMACDSPVAPLVRPVDRRTIEGSYPGDTRAKAAPAVMPANPAPREPMGQFPNGKFCKSAPAPASFPADADSDAGN